MNTLRTNKEWAEYFTNEAEKQPDELCFAITYNERNIRTEISDMGYPLDQISSYDLEDAVHEALIGLKDSIAIGIDDNNPCDACFETIQREVRSILPELCEGEDED